MAIGPFSKGVVGEVGGFFNEGSFFRRKELLQSKKRGKTHQHARRI